MIRNYLSGTAGDQNNTLLAAAVYNMKKWMRLEKQETTGFNFSLDLPETYIGLGNMQPYRI